MIYLDSSVVLAALFAENRSPPDALWQAQLVSSRLLEYEIFVRAYARQLDAASLNLAHQLINEVELAELTPSILKRALAPFPQPVRTLDALHLATMDFLRLNGQTVELASYDQRLNTAAQALGFTLCPL